MTDHRATWRWRPEPGWLMLALLGMTVGGLLGAVYVVVVVIADVVDKGVLNGDTGGTLIGLLGLAVFGSVGGAVTGLAGGVAVGVVLTFLVGRDMPGRAASALTFVGTAATVALLLWLALPAVLSGAYEDHLAVLELTSAVAAGLGALWFRGQLPDRRHRDAVQADQPRRPCAEL
ncbi:membrane hypothetical protein [metagenome]|uniref:Uncharacterized protein n=1 Tax=metagenome TaxID=256318 RepID=A0A2P2CBW7_9ZZZZ